MKALEKKTKRPERQSVEEMRSIVKNLHKRFGGTLTNG